MDVSGLITAASERISFGKTDGLLFTLYNAEMDIHFYILALDELVFAWKNIHVNHYYRLTALKAGTLETCSGRKMFLLKTTSKSIHIETDRLHIKNFEITEDLKAIIAIPKDSILMKPDVDFNLISYQGFVTKVKNSALGLYELDFKVLLFTTFNVCCPLLEEGIQVFISNAHLMKDHRGSLALVCCGLSSVKSIDIRKEDEVLNLALSRNNICLQYDLNIFDLIWLEKLSESLKMKFATLISLEEISFEENSEVLKNILEYFLNCKNYFTDKKWSLTDEYFSFPHKCFPFSENMLPTDCDILYISDILEKAKVDVSWININSKWKFSICNQDSMVLIGILYLSTNGNFHITDQTHKLPVLLTQQCNDCYHDQNIINKFTTSENAYMVAIQEYDIIFEVINCENDIQKFVQCIRASYCRVYPLTSFCLKKTEHYILTSQVFFHKSEKNENSDIMDNSFTHNSQTIQKRILVISRIWNIQNKTPYCFRILVLINPEKCNNVDSIVNKAIMEDTFNFYDTDDDAEFANLISKMSFLCIEDQARLGYLCFKKIDNYSHLFPGHIYILNFKDITNRNFGNSTSESSINGIFTWNMTSDIEIFHDSICLGNHWLQDYEVAEFYGVKEILTKRQLKQNIMVSCILSDKTFVDFEILDGKSVNEGNATLCMSVKDVISEDTIHVYVPYFSEFGFGLLPGSLLELHGFHCVCSQSGNLYLKPSLTFGIQIKQQQNMESRNCSPKLKPYLVLMKKSFGNIFHTSFQRFCNVVKIISAEIFSICHQCNNSLQENCLCFSPENIKIKACGLIDDGNQLLIAYCYGKAAKKLLSLNEQEWQKLASYVKCSHQFLKFSDKTYLKSNIYLPVMNQVFNTYCSSKAICKQLLFKCIYIPGPYSSITDTYSVWCKDITDPVVQDLMSDFYMKLKNVGNFEK